MKKVMIVSALIAACVGCTSSTRIEWGGKTALRGADGSVILANGQPCYESEKNVYKDSNWLTKREERDVSVKVNADGSYEAGIGSRVNDVSSNGVAMVTGGIDAATRLVSACAAAYATIAGGGAQTDTVLSVAQKVYAFFASKGGDAAKATVTTEGGTVRVTDGTTTIQCDRDGNCTSCADGACSIQ